MFSVMKSGKENDIMQELKKIADMPVGRRKTELEKVENGKTLLHAAVERGYLPVLQTLLALFIDIKLDINKPDNDNNTPLHIAVIKGSFEMAKELVSNDISLTSVNNLKKTALEIVEEKRLQSGSHQETYANIAALLRTRLEWQEAAVGFRFNRVVGLIEESFPAIKPAGGTDKVFFIGSTGAGKSTLLNYLNGTQYKTTYGLKPTATRIGGELEIAKVGQGMSSQTLYPQVINKNNLNYTYCDLAGLADSRGKAERICAASSVQMLSRLPGNIKGIVLVLDIPGFNASKGASFKGTAVAMARMVANNPKLMESVFYTITKIPPQCRDPKTDKILTSPEDIIDNYVDPLLNDLSGSDSDSESIALKFMLEQMKAHKNNILIPDITDHGQSKDQLEKLLNDLPGNDSNLYNFISHDGAQKSFNDTLQGIAEGYLSRHREIEKNLPIQIKDLEARKKIKKNEISDWEKQIKDRQQDLKMKYDSTAVDKQIQQKNQQITNNKDIINAKNSAITNRLGQISLLSGELATLDINDMVHVEDVKYDIPGRPTEHHLRYQSRFPCYGPSSVGGFYWGYGELNSKLLPECNAMSGLYSAMLYATGGLTKVDVVFNTHKKYMYASRISQLRADIRNLQSQNNLDQNDINRLNIQNTNLDKEILACQTEKIQGAADNKIREARLNDEIKTRQEWLKTANQILQDLEIDQKKLEAKMADLKREITVNQELFDIVYRASHILDLGKIAAFKTFWSEYENTHPDARSKYDAWIKEMTSIATQTQHNGANQNQNGNNNEKGILYSYNSEKEKQSKAKAVGQNGNVTEPFSKQQKVNHQ